MGEVTAAAKRVQEAIHTSASGYACGGFAGFGFGRTGREMDALVGKELEGGHKKARKSTPPPRAR